MLKARRSWMIQMQPAIEPIGTSGYSGTLKPRGRSGWRRRRGGTPIATRRNAWRAGLALRAQDHADRDDQERDQRSDARHLEQEVDRDHAGEEREDDRDE